jgi:spore maturation protein CgeB
VLVREARLQVHESPRPLRWAIKNPAPAGPAAEEWGDTHFARDLADALRALGHEVVLDHREAFERPTARHDDVALVLRGPIPLDPTPEQVSIAWVISHPDRIDAREAAAYDAVFAASRTWAAARSEEWGIPVEPLLQATNPARFSPDGAEPDSGPDLLFVGNSRKTYRTIVRDAVESGLPLTVYGADWEPFLPEGVVAADYLENARLGRVYRSAGIVLNDHWDDMREHGFLSNRLFDAVASGARVVTDAVAGLDGVFGPSVQPYRDRAELVRLCTLADRDAVFGSDSARIAAATRVAREHSFAARATVLAEAAVRLRRERGFV